MPIARFAPPTARVPMQTAGRPVSWACASAMNEAAPSCLVATMLMPAASRPSSSPRKLSPGTVNAQRTPARRTASANIRPTETGCAGGRRLGSALTGGVAISGSLALGGRLGLVERDDGEGLGIGSRLRLRLGLGLERCDRLAHRRRLGAVGLGRGRGISAGIELGRRLELMRSLRLGGHLDFGGGLRRPLLLDRVCDLVGHGAIGPGIEVMTRLRITITTTNATRMRASSCDAMART